MDGDKMTKKLYGLTGLARSGKDTLADKMNRSGYLKFAFADALKQSAAIYFGIPVAWCYDDEKDTRIVPEYDATVRQLLQKFGTESTRDVFGEDFWIKRLSRGLNFEANNVISDVRFDNEADWIRDNGGTIVHIIRPNQELVNVHSSESGIITHHTDELILNDGSLDKLYKNVDALLMME